MEDQEKQTLRDLLCEALGALNGSKEMLLNVKTANRRDIVRNMDRIEMQISANTAIFDKLNAIVDTVVGDTVVSAKVSDPAIITVLEQRIAAGNFGIPVELVRDERSPTGISYKIDGFYKSGSVLLIPQLDGSMLARARYNEETRLHDFRDLVSLNYDWWTRSKARYEGWAAPDAGWVEWMIEFGWIERVVTPVTTYAVKG